MIVIKSLILDHSVTSQLTHALPQSTVLRMYHPFVCVRSGAKPMAEVIYSSHMSSEYDNISNGPNNSNNCLKILKFNKN